MLIEILVFPGVDELDALGPLEVLRNAAAVGADFRVRLVSLEGTAEIVGGHGCTLVWTERSVPSDGLTWWSFPGEAGRNAQHKALGRKPSRALFPQPLQKSIGKEQSWHRCARGPCSLPPRDYSEEDAASRIMMR